MAKRLTATDIELLEQGKSFFFGTKKDALLFSALAYQAGHSTEVYQDELLGFVAVPTWKYYDQVYNEIAEQVGEHKLKLLAKLQARLEYNQL